MSAKKTNTTWKMQSGQTLIIALMILGVLLILGFVFLGMISRNIRMGATMQDRSVANDLAEAGIRFAHSRLLNSELGADWRPTVTPPLNFRDPDTKYLQPGGPDGLGPYTRVTFEAGRALIRVRYGPSDANIFLTTPSGPLRLPGKARDYTIIEAVGKTGSVRSNDPTSTLQSDRAESRKLIAFARIGVIEQAFAVWNKYNVSRPIEIGTPDNLGVYYEGQPVTPTMQIGSTLPVYNFGNPPTPGPTVAFGGSAMFQGQLLVHGNVQANLNATLGDNWLVTDTILGASDTSSQLVVNSARWDRTTNSWVSQSTTLTNPGNPSLDSRQSLFSTIGGLIRDGVGAPDADGFTRGIRRFEAPSILRADPDTNLTRYQQITRLSGWMTANGNAGNWGFGHGVYVNNTADRQNRADEQGRETVGTNESLVYDWLNPNNGQANSGWQGPYYVPRGAYVQLLSDGFLIVRDARGPAGQRTWREPDGSPSRAPDGTIISSSVCRFKIATGNDGAQYIVNSYTLNPATGNPIDINSVTAADIQNYGQKFNGVLFFEGNARVRGVIPTNVQMTLVSNATIYIEGSITKGIVQNLVTNPSGAGVNTRLTQPSTSMLMLMAKDFVALNTSQFVGPDPTQTLEPVSDVPSAVEFDPIRLRGPGSSLSLRTELLLDPNSGTGPSRPDTWAPYADKYVSSGTSNGINAGLLMVHTMDDGVAPNAFISMDVNYGLATPTYLWDLDSNNAATQYAPYSTSGYITPGYGAATANRGPIKGFGVQSWQRYSKFEGAFYSMLLSQPGNYTTFPLMNPTPEHGTYQVLAQDTNEFTLRPNSIGGAPTNDYLLARAAMVPGDVRIETSVYAEEGSFFVIPSPWFNPNPNDRRDTYASLGATDPERQLARLETYGAAPEMPFYGEPIDVRVQIVGSVNENMPPPISQQGEWQKKWGWIPRTLGATTTNIPQSHVPPQIFASDPNLANTLYVPNLIISYDPSLGTGRTWDPLQPSPFATGNRLIRVDPVGNPLPPLPRLPVSATLAYFGEENQ